MLPDGARQYNYAFKRRRGGVAYATAEMRVAATASVEVNRSRSRVVIPNQSIWRVEIRRYAFEKGCRRARDCALALVVWGPYREPRTRGRSGGEAYAFLLQRSVPQSHRNTKKCVPLRALESSEGS